MPAISDLLLQARGEDVSAGRTLEELGAELEAFGAIEAEAEAGVDTGAAFAELGSLRRELEDLGRQHEEATLSVDATRGHAEADALEARLKRVRGEGKLDLDVAAAAAKVEAFRAAAGRDVKVGLDFELNQAQLGKLVAARAAVEALEGAGGAAGGLGGGGGGGDWFRQLPVLPAMSGQAAAAITAVLIPAVTSLIAFLGALVASAGAAAAGLGALGVTAVAALGPVGILAAVAFARMTQASQAAESYKTAQEGVRSASDSLASAEEGLANAQSQQNQAQEQLRRARRDAAAQIRDDLRTAVDGLRGAEQNLTDSQYQARRAEEALTMARQEARRAIVDERLAAEGAALSHKGAVLSLAEARRNLRELESQRGEPGGPSGLDIRQARLQVQQAELDVKNTRVDSARAQRDLTDAERAGVSGAPAVVEARHNVREADQRVAESHRAVRDAERELRRAQAASVEQAPQVVAAREQVASATRQVASAQRQVGQAAHRLEIAQGKANKAWKEFQDTRAALAVLRVVRQIGRVLQSAVEPILRGMARGLRELMPLFRALRPQLERLGEAMGQAFVRLMRELSSPAWQRFFRVLLRNAAELVRVGSRGFILMLRIIRNIVEAGLPFLVRGLRDVNRFLAGLARGSKDVDLSGVIHQLGLWIRLTGAVSRVFLAFVRAGASAGGELVEVITRGLDSWADWLDSTEGRNRIAQFFRNTLPLARSLFDLVGQLALLFLELGELLAPVLKPFIDVLSIVARWVNRILDLFNRLPAPVRDAILFVVNPVQRLADALRIVDDVAGRVFDALPGLARGAGRGLRDAWDWIKGGARRIWSAIGDLITGPISDAFGWLRRAAGNAVEWIGDRFRALGGPFRWLRGVVRDVIGWLGDRVGDMASPFEAVADKIVDAFHAIRGPLVDAVNWIIDNVINRIPGVQIDTIGGAPQEGGRTRPRTSRAFTEHRNRYAAGGRVAMQGGGSIGHAVRRGARVGEGAVEGLLAQFDRLRGAEGLLDFLPPWLSDLGSWIMDRLRGAIGRLAERAASAGLSIPSPSEFGVEIGRKIAGGQHGGRALGPPGVDQIDARLTRDEFVVTPDGESLLERLTFPGILNWLAGVQRPAVGYQGGGRVGPAGRAPAPALGGAGDGKLDPRAVSEFRARVLKILDGLRDRALKVWRDLWAAVTEIADDAEDRVSGGSRAFTRDILGDWRDLREDAGPLWRDVARAIWDPLRETFARIERDALPGLKAAFRRTSVDVAQLFTGAGRIVGRVARYVVDAVNRVISVLGDKKDTLPALKLGELPDPSSVVPGHFAGGVVETPMYRVGEEAPLHKEVVLTENPRHRARNRGLWAAAGRMLGVPGFQAGGFPGRIAPVPGFPGERANTQIMGALTSWLKRFDAVLYDAFGGAPHVSTEHTVYGTAADVGPRSGNWGGLFGEGLRYAVQHGYTPVFYDGSYGTTALADHGPGNHAHITFLTAAELLAGKTAGAVSAAIAKLIPDVKVKGAGPVAEVVRRAVERMVNAGNRRISRIQGRADIGVSGAGAYRGNLDTIFPHDGSATGGGPPIAPWQAAMLAEKAGLPGITYAQIAKGESNFYPGATSADGGYGLWQMTPRVQSAATVAAWQRIGSYFNPWDNARMAKFLAGAGTGVSNYYGTGFLTSPNAHWHGEKHIPGLSGGRALAHRMLGLIGAELGVKELVAMPAGTEVMPGVLTSRLTRALMGPGLDAGRGAAAAGSGGGPAGLPGLKFVVNGDIVSDHPEPVQAFLGNRKVAAWVRDLANDEIREERRHDELIGGMG